MNNFQVGDRVSLKIPGYSHLPWYGNEGEIVAISPLQNYVHVIFDKDTHMERLGYNESLFNGIRAYYNNSEYFEIVSYTLSNIPEPDDEDLI